MEGIQNFTSKKWRPTPYDELFQVWLTVLSMIEARGYVVGQEKKNLRWTNYETQYNTYKQQFIDMYTATRVPGDIDKSFRQLLVDEYDHREGGRCMVRFISPSSGKHISLDQLKYLIVITKTAIPYRDIFLISSHKLAAGVSDKLQTEQFNNYNFFMDYEMLVDPEAFHLASKHIKLTNSEKKDFYKNNDLSASKIPQHTKDDAVIVKNGWKPGDLIRILRTNYFTNGINRTTIFYRVVSSNEAGKRKAKKK